MKNIITIAGLFIGLASALANTNPIALRKAERRRQQQEAAGGGPSYKAHFFNVPIDHFKNDSMYAPHVSGSFPLRYWFDPTYYEEGGPVILFEGGEASAASRMPILYQGIVNKLAKATRGMGVVIEHRYYGASQPMPDLSNKNLRFLTTDQAMADNAYFAQHMVFPGFEHLDLTSKKVAWIQYGGSYSGAFAAFSRKLYPGTWWGAISSSGVTEAIYDYWQYFEPIRKFAPQDCVLNTQYLTNALDNIFIHNKEYRGMVKSAFNMESVTHDRDFLYTLQEYSIGDWQSTNWDPKVNYDGFQRYCKAVTTNSLLYPDVAKRKGMAQKILSEGGYGDNLDTLTYPLLNWIGFAQGEVVDACPSKNLDTCFNTYNAASYADRNVSNNGLLCWPWQYCHQWGYLQTGSGAPKNQLSMISRLIDLEYSTNICRDAFGLNTPPDTDAINKYGGFDITYPRLAIIDGNADPWRYATPHSPTQFPWNRTSTLIKPFYLIDHGAVHHWDENGIRATEYRPGFPPEYIRRIQRYETEFVLKWMNDYYLAHPDCKVPKGVKVTPN